MLMTSFVFDSSSALTCSTAKSVERPRRDCQTHFHHGGASVASHSDEGDRSPSQTELHLLVCVPHLPTPVSLSPSPPGAKNWSYKNSVGSKHEASLHSSLSSLLLLVFYWPCCSFCLRSSSILFVHSAAVDVFNNIFLFDFFLLNCFIFF